MELCYLSSSLGIWDDRVPASLVSSPRRSFIDCRVTWRASSRRGEPKIEAGEVLNSATTSWHRPDFGVNAEVFIARAEHPQRCSSLLNLTQVSLMYKNLYSFYTNNVLISAVCNNCTHDSETSNIWHNSSKNDEGKWDDYHPQNTEIIFILCHRANNLAKVIFWYILSIKSQKSPKLTKLIFFYCSIFSYYFLLSHNSPISYVIEWKFSQNLHLVHSIKQKPKVTVNNNIENFSIVPYFSYCSLLFSP